MATLTLNRDLCDVILTMKSKSHLRDEMRSWRNQLDPEMHAVWSERICTNLNELVGDQEISTIHTFLPLGSEVNIDPVIQSCLNKGLRVVVSETLDPPKLRHLALQPGARLVIGKFGTKYPHPADRYTGDFDLILVPGLAFDHRGNRIGYGLGYYDLLLANLPTTCLKVGVAFAHQCLTHNLPTEDHDQPVDLIVNEHGTRRIRS